MVGTGVKCPHMNMIITLYIRNKISQYEYDFKYIYPYAYNVTVLRGDLSCGFVRQ